MGKRLWLGIVILMLMLSTGCQLFSGTGGQAVEPTTFNPEYATLAALATQVYQTQSVVIPPTETPSPTIDPLLLASPTFTPLPGNIVITGIVEKPEYSILVTWEVTGEFPSGFRVVWTDQQGVPTFPESNSIVAGSSTSRSALITVDPGTIYYLRVCRFLYDACDIYSDLKIFAVMPYTPTPDINLQQTATSAAATLTKTAAAASSGTGGNSNSPSTDSIPFITWMVINKAGKAYIEWKDTGSAPLGYKLLYSKTSTKPTLGEKGVTYYVIQDPSARSAYVEGDDDTLYYYRICRATATGCGPYSLTYTFTFPEATPKP